MSDEVNNTNLALILDRLGELKSDIKGIETKLDGFARQAERHDARIDTIEKQIVNFVPAGVLDERRIAYDKRLVDVEAVLKELPRKADADRGNLITRLIATASLIAGLSGWWAVSHPAQVLGAGQTTTSTSTSSQTTQKAAP